MKTRKRRKRRRRTRRRKRRKRTMRTRRRRRRRKGSPEKRRWEEHVQEEKHAYRKTQRISKERMLSPN